MSKQKSSSHDKTDPYRLTKNWTDGTLCFWRGNNLYSQASKDYLEETVRGFAKRERQLTNLQNNQG